MSAVKVTQAIPAMVYTSNMPEGGTLPVLLSWSAEDPLYIKADLAHGYENSKEWLFPTEALLELEADPETTMIARRDWSWHVEYTEMVCYIKLTGWINGSPSRSRIVLDLQSVMDFLQGVSQYYSSYSINDAAEEILDGLNALLGYNSDH